MKITDTEALRAGQAGSVSRPTAITESSAVGAPAAGASAPAAQVELSSQAQSIAVAKAAVNAAPDTRDDLVASLKSQIDSGTYRVSGSDVAEQMIRRAHADQVR